MTKEEVKRMDDNDAMGRKLYKVFKKIVKVQHDGSDLPKWEDLNHHGKGWHAIADVVNKMNKRKPVKNIWKEVKDVIDSCASYSDVSESKIANNLLDELIKGRNMHRSGDYLSEYFGLNKNQTEKETIKKLADAFIKCHTKIQTEEFAHNIIEDTLKKMPGRYTLEFAQNLMDHQNKQKGE